RSSEECCVMKTRSTVQVLVFWFGLTGCGAAAENQRSAAHPSSSGPLCDYVGLEASEAPVHENIDSIALVAQYRLSEPNLPPPEQPIELKFRVDRSRV